MCFALIKKRCPNIGSPMAMPLLVGHAPSLVGHTPSLVGHAPSGYGYASSLVGHAHSGHGHAPGREEGGARRTIHALGSLPLPTRVARCFTTTTLTTKQTVDSNCGLTFPAGCLINGTSEDLPLSSFIITKKLYKN